MRLTCTFTEYLEFCREQERTLQTEHGVDSSSRVFSRRRSAFQRGKRRGLGGWRRIRCGCTRRCNGSLSSGGLGGNLLEISEIARLFRARLNGGKRQLHLTLHGTGDAVQLPDELFELFRTAKIQAAVPQ